MFAIIRSGGKQYRVRQGDRIAVELLDVPEGSEVTLDEVLMIERDGGAVVGTPLVAGATVTATVEAHDRAKKVIFFHYKNKTRQKRTRGHRQHQTRLQITAIAPGA
ncbi:MAG: 50S ribosomal protein L21 [Chloroflexi bacterium]|nr:50S ribosomal protein L21 [Chloroflexota bacterium]MDA1148038.1 50S ribosomal protein L21 [Chloroflexota bacterium]